MTPLGAFLGFAAVLTIAALLTLPLGWLERRLNRPTFIDRRHVVNEAEAFCRDEARRVK